ncbi:hypothetical protein M5689_003671 [Euphorbia peplus]|nr:hypothetical protein M5689_003671 [Euphorbia peplus]
MGRKPKNVENSCKEESGNPLNKEDKEADTETDNPCLASLKKKRSSLVSTQNDLEEQEVNHSKAPSKNIVKNAFGVRRSCRLQAAAVATESHYIEQIIEEITVSESEEENEPTDDKFPKPSIDDKIIHEKSEGKDVHEKIDYIVELVQTQQKAINELNSTRIGESSGTVGKDKYKILYFRSQNKIEALTKENDELIKKLENAHGIIEFYKKRAEEMLEKGKEADLTSLSSRVTEAASLEHETGKRKR